MQGEHKEHLGIVLPLKIDDISLLEMNIKRISLMLIELLTDYSQVRPEPFEIEKRCIFNGKCICVNALIRDEKP